MTQDQIVEMIAADIDELTGVQAKVRAESVYPAALNSLGRIASIPWNKKQETVSVISGQSLYSVTDDLLTNYNTGDIRGIVDIWRTDTQGWRVPIISMSEFNTYRRGSSATGAPHMAMTYWDGDVLKLELYYIPDSNYDLWLYFRKSMELEDIPEDYQEIVVHKGTMLANSASSASFIKGSQLYKEILAEVNAESIRKWEGSQIRPAYAIGHYDTGRMQVDSENWYGLPR
jgi:hypothetical protein